MLGQQKLQKLFKARVAIFGIGGVGGYVAEALARSGVGEFLLVDSDAVSLSNINRQIIATHKSVGRPKVQVMRERILDINPAALVDARQTFYLPQNSSAFDFSKYSYIVDAVDTVSAKLEIILQAKAAGVPVISAMGAGNKLDPTQFKVADIYQTSVCPLARVMRRECKKRGVDSLKVVYSTEPPARILGQEQNSRQGQNAAATEKVAAASNDFGASNDLGAPIDSRVSNDLSAPSNLGAENVAGKKIVPASAAFCPSVAGLIIASQVVKDLTE